MNSVFEILDIRVEQIRRLEPTDIEAQALLVIDHGLQTTDAQFGICSVKFNPKPFWRARIQKEVDDR
jgi:hypothetical protein